MKQHKEFRLSLSPWWVLLPAIVGVLAVIFSVYYLTHSQAELAQRYLAHGGCFYRYDDWLKQFFNETTKQAGNQFCMAGVVAGLILLSWSIRVLIKRPPKPSVTLKIERYDTIILGGLLLVGLSLWLWGNLSVPRTYDEVFSAVNCAGEGPWMSLSYYMLPNNHVLFNAINGGLFGWCCDLVSSGRVLSGLAHGLLIVLWYFWLRSKVNHRWMAALYCLVLMLQFPAWGFSFQARGYAVYLLCAWASAIFLERYFYRKDAFSLLVHGIACVIGFGVMPSFLFWYAALMLLAGAFFLSGKNVNRQLVITHVLVLTAVFLIYLPSISFSGLGALTENQYVRVAHPTWPDFWDNFRSGFDATIRYSFASDVDGRSWLYPALFALPLLLLPFIWNTPGRKYVLGVFLIWLVFLLLQMKFRHYPFMRNMTAHCSVSLAVLLLSLHFFLKKIGNRAGYPQILPLGMLVFCAVSGVHFVRFMNDHGSSALYFYDTKGRYNDQVGMLKNVPATAHVWTSDESFFPRYILTKRGISASHCYDSTQSWFVIDKQTGENPPVDRSTLYIADSANQYYLLRKKDAAMH